MSQKQNNDMQQHFYRTSAADFSKIPGSPVAYWVSDLVRSAFTSEITIESKFKPRKGIDTGNNEKFLRHWFEVSIYKVDFQCNSEVDSNNTGKKWFPYNKGGDFRKWYGNFHYLIDWEQSGFRVRNYTDDNGKVRSNLRNQSFFFKEGITWTDISSSSFGARYLPSGFMCDNAGSACYGESILLPTVLGMLTSKVAFQFLKVLNPTLHFQAGNISSLPLPAQIAPLQGELVSKAIKYTKSDWDSYEVSWDFARQTLLDAVNHHSPLNAIYQRCRVLWHEITLEMQRFEEENNRIFIEAYCLQDELTPEVPLSEITLTCNPHYRYGGNLTDEEREARLQSDTICELISYVIGCMMGRYSLDREGLVYAHGGNEGFKALVEEGAYATFAADEDGILPLSTDSWFEDDVATRLEAFVCTVWGTETLEENLQFIADSLCLSAIKPVKKGGETSRETLRRYLSTQFYKDHLKTYKKRPIYWLFSSGKEKAFECLVYLHRYNEATLSRMRTEYVTPLLGQMAGRIERLRLQQTEASTSDAKRIGKEIDSLTKQLSELRAFDDQLKHHADMRITLDLDDGVKVNYGKFGTLLSDVKAITGDKGE
ncbi:BREX-1 system adenine-specific DNA-methyltransferase PglX [Aeromonas veronii]